MPPVWAVERVASSRDFCALDLTGASRREISVLRNAPGIEMTTHCDYDVNIFPSYAHHH